MPSLVGSEMCIRDRATRAPTRVQQSEEHSVEQSANKALRPEQGSDTPNRRILPTQHGIGLLSEHNGIQTIIKCGSKSFTPTQQQYATIELECLAIVWAIQKCEFFLKGLPTFTVATDHRPLVGTFSKNLADLTNPRLLSLREKTSAHCFIVTYVPGKTCLLYTSPSPRD